MTKISRRFLVQAALSSFAAHQLPTIEPVNEETALAPIDPQSLNPKLVQYAYVNFSGLCDPWYPLRSWETNPIYEYYSDFHNFVIGAQRILHFNPRERAALFQTPYLAALLQRPPSERAEKPFNTIDDLLDDGQVIRKIFQAWDIFKHKTQNAKGVVKPPDPERLLQSLSSSVFVDHSAFNMGERPLPSWWQGCSEHEKLLVWLECAHIDMHCFPSGLFISDESRLIELMRLKSPEINHYLDLSAKIVDVDIVSPHFFHEHFGPETVHEHFAYCQRMLRQIGSDAGSPSAQRRSKAHKLASARNNLHALESDTRSPSAQRQNETHESASTRSNLHALETAWRLLRERLSKLATHIEAESSPVEAESSPAELIRIEAPPEGDRIELPPPAPMNLDSILARNGRVDAPHQYSRIARMQA